MDEQPARPGLTSVSVELIDDERVLAPVRGVRFRYYEIDPGPIARATGAPGDGWLSDPLIYALRSEDARARLFLLPIVLPGLRPRVAGKVRIGAEELVDDFESARILGWSDMPLPIVRSDAEAREAVRRGLPRPYVLAQESIDPPRWATGPGVAEVDTGPLDEILARSLALRHATRSLDGVAGPIDAARLRAAVVLLTDPGWGEDERTLAERLGLDARRIAPRALVAPADAPLVRVQAIAAQAAALAERIRTLSIPALPPGVIGPLAAIEGRARLVARELAAAPRTSTLRTAAR